MRSLLNRPARKRGTRRRSATAASISAAGFIAATFIGAAPASAADYENQYFTFNRPSTIEAAGETWMAWADTSANGAVHMADFKQPIPSNDTPAAVPEWTDPASSTYYGTGPAIEYSASSGAMVVAWADLTDDEFWLAEPASNGGFTCQGSFGTSPATPYLVSEGKNGVGQLYLVTTNVNNTMSIWTVNVPTPAECAVGAHISRTLVKNITTDTTWGGPALVISGYGTSSERFWLIWSGTGGTHYINVAEYDQNWTRLNKYTETDQFTNTDIGGAFMATANQVWFSYCGATNSVPFYQEFSDTGFSEPAAHSISGGTCTVTTYYDSKNTITYYSGGVGASYDYTDDKMILSWPDGTAVVWDAI